MTSRKRKSSSGPLESGRYEVRSGSFSPSIFGNNVAVQTYRLILQKLKITVPPLVIGATPDLSKITKNKAQRSRGLMLECCEASRKDKTLFHEFLVYGKYFPEALLVYAYITMTKGVYLTTRDKLLIEEAIAIEKSKAKTFTTARMRKQRSMQLNHLKNTLDHYVNGVAQDGTTEEGHKIRLYHTEKGRKREQKKSRDKSRNKNKLKMKASEMTIEERKFFAEVYMMMRVLYPSMKVREMFNRFMPKIDQKAIIHEARLCGFTDSKDRPSGNFKQIMMSALNNHINVRF
jgi:hypothetical protein